MGRRRNLWLVVAACAVAALFAAGLWQLFEIRFTAGDIYPEYSTLNAAPKGAKACYESLDTLSSVNATRNFTSLLRLKNLAGATLVFAGADGRFFGDDTTKNFEKFESYLIDGAHVVATMNVAGMAVSTDYETEKPLVNPWDPWADDDDDPISTGGGKATKPGTKKPEIRKPRKRAHGDDDTIAAATRWDFRFRRAVRKKDEPKDGFEAQPTPAAGGLSSLPRWFSAWRFETKNGGWQTLATVGDQPVIIRRPYGKGSLTLVSDSTFLSNEALWRVPHPEFLLWLLGSHQRIIFDETLHGTQSDPGIMSLVAHYHLFGFLTGAGLLLILFVWRSATSLVPGDDAADSNEETRDIVDGAAGSSGLVNLMRQSVPPASLLGTCFTEWAKSPFIRRKYSDDQVATVRDTIAATNRQTRKKKSALVIDTYRRLADQLRTRL